MSSVSDGGYEGLPFWYSAQSVVAYVSGLESADAILKMAVQFRDPGDFGHGPKGIYHVPERCRREM